MNFGDAIVALKDGNNVRRRGWNGMHIYLEDGLFHQGVGAMTPTARLVAAAVDLDLAASRHRREDRDAMIAELRERRAKDAATPTAAPDEPTDEELAEVERAAYLARSEQGSPDATRITDCRNAGRRALYRLGAERERARRPKIEIVGINDAAYWPGRLVVLVNGEVLSAETYGSEPEDNCRTREFRWVERVLQLVAERCGADVLTREVSGTWNDVSIGDALREIGAADALEEP